MDTPEQTTPQMAERGTGPDGQPAFLDRRLFVQFLSWGGCCDVEAVSAALSKTDLQGALYLDLHDPKGIALAVCREDPDYFSTGLRDLLQQEPFSSLEFKPGYTMFGRTYTIGYESDLEHVLLHRTQERICNPAWPWAIWYPLRRTGAFARLPGKEQREILSEHGRIGSAYGQADLARDIRLACHGLDTNDNDFVVGLIGSELYPLSHIVQTMRKTVQTSEYIEKLGPFFVGRVAWQSASELS